MGLITVLVTRFAKQQNRGTSSYKAPGCAPTDVDAAKSQAADTLNTYLFRPRLAIIAS
jgi:hypothetical protein